MVYGYSETLNKLHLVMPFLLVVPMGPKKDSIYVVGLSCSYKLNIHIY